MKFQQCTRCLMDTSAQNIHFDINGICNYCSNFIIKLNSEQQADLNLNDLIEKIKSDGKNKPYDCIVGVSGGVDSSYTLVKVKELGLRPLAVHMDNGWNSELATNNIKNLVDGLDVHLYTHVINWDEYRELMQAFFDVDVIDIELLYDNAMLAVNYRQANKYGIKYILSGSNTSTEGMDMPKNWNWFKYDKKNIIDIGKRKDVKIQTFPIFGTLDFIYYGSIKKIKWVPFLDYLPMYNKFEAIEILQNKFNYKPYPYKHYESIFTRFYQGYILPNKFGVDKRKIHLSTLIISGQMSKDEAINQIEGLAYPSERELQDDIEYFLKKMRWSTIQLKEYLERPEIAHSDYGSEIDLWNSISKLKKTLKKYL